MKWLVRTWVLALGLLPGLVVQGNDPWVALSEIVRPPVATRQLEPAVFVNRAVIQRLGVSEGDPVFLRAGDREVEVRVYEFFQPVGKAGLHRDVLRRLGLGYGPAKLRLVPAGAKATLRPDAIRRRIVAFAGDTAKWRHTVLAAPHADCDLKTGEIVQLVHERTGVPCVTAWKHRLSYRGIWYDVNRPLMKLPRADGQGVVPERVVNDSSRAVFSRYLKAVWEAGRVKPWHQLDFYFDLHGHDLTARLPGGRRVYRSVVEAVGVGFTMEELRRIKNVYNRYWRKALGPGYPRIYFGNLPEDQIYNYRGARVSIFYTALGTRTYGILRSDLVRRALHFETPDTFRLTPEMRARTAGMIETILTFVRDSLPPVPEPKGLLVLETPRSPTKHLLLVPAGEFTMGAPGNLGWACDRPQHRVWLDAFQIDALEVTNAEYADFLNNALAKGLITVGDGEVRDAAHPSHVLCRLVSSRPLSQLKFDGGRFSVVRGREAFPAVYVSWYGADLYARAHGKRLPTEAEWERAASWADGAKWLYAYPGTDAVLALENCENSADPFEGGVLPWTTPVGYYSDVRSPVGCLDMSGNVWEWCSDWFGYGYYRQEPEGGWRNPTGPATGTLKSVRGGAWNTETPFTATYFRLGIDPNETLVNVGFRCAR